MPLFYRFTRISAGWRFAYPAYKTIYLSEGYSTPQVRQAPRRRARTAGAVPLVCRVAATPYPAWSPKSPLALGLLKLPVLAASKSLRRSRKAGTARMDAG
ncbi:putative transcriptional regulator (LysR family) [Klebsiella quasipneumoniae]|nr:putative transcriptional regulator (LysR family) [Klebsiella quasipneumoniae]